MLVIAENRVRKSIYFICKIKFTKKSSQKNFFFCKIKFTSYVNYCSKLSQESAK